MEMINAREQTTLVGELKQGRELANLLKNQLDPSNSREACEALLEKIVSTYDKALSVLAWKNLKRESPFEGSGIESSISPIANSPRSDCSEQVLKGQECQNKDVFKKRKTLPRWCEQVRVCSVTGLEGPLDDGHSWRKYGQKDILGAKFPRAYYRCTHRNTQGCLATKQVQRSDEDSSIFEVTYKGRHSCIRTTSNSASRTTSIEKGIKEKEDKMKRRQSQEKLSNLGNGLKFETEGLKTKEDEMFSFISFPYTPFEPEIDFMGYSQSNYFSSPCQINNFIFSSTTEKSESDLTDAIATPTSVTDSPFEDFDFDPTFSLDNLSYFS